MLEVEPRKRDGLEILGFCHRLDVSASDESAVHLPRSQDSKRPVNEKGSSSTCNHLLRTLNHHSSASSCSLNSLSNSSHQQLLFATYVIRIIMSIWTSQNWKQFSAAASFKPFTISSRHSSSWVVYGALLTGSI